MIGSMDSMLEELENHHEYITDKINDNVREELETIKIKLSNQNHEEQIEFLLKIYESIFRENLDLIEMYHE